MCPSFITGCAGFIGSHLAKSLTDSGEEVVGLVRDVVPSKWLDEALENVIKVKGDLRDFRLLKRILNQYGVDKVFHLGAQSIVSKSLKNPIETLDTNVMGTVKVLEACRQLDVERVLVQSTDKIYGGGLDKRVSSPLNPTEPYGTSKACCGLIAQNFLKVYEMSIIISRPCNVYGYDKNSRIVPNTIRSCLRGENPVIWEGEITKRQYIYIRDLVSALIHLIEFAGIGRTGIFNIATPDVLTQEEVVKEVLKNFPTLKPTYLTREKPKEISQQSMRFDNFGWIPEFSFEQGIKATIEKFRKYGG